MSHNTQEVGGEGGGREEEGGDREMVGEDGEKLELASCWGGEGEEGVG